MKVGFSIRSKFLVVMSLLLAGCVGVYLLIAVNIFKSDKERLVFDLNKSQVSNLASELETQFVGFSDKFKLFAILTGGGQSRYVSDLFSQDSNVVSVSLYKNNGTEVLRKFQNKNYMETYGLSAEFFEKQLSSEKTIPFQTILKNGEAIWNATSVSGPPLLGYGRSVIVEDGQGVAIDQMAVIGYIRLDSILNSISIVKLNQITIANSEGEILAHSDPQTLRSATRLVGNSLFQAALDSKIKTSVITLNVEGQKSLGAFSKAYGGKLLVLAQASEKTAFQAVSDLVERSLIFSLIILTAAFLAAVLLSRSLTNPLAQLVERMSLVSQGDLTSQIPIQTRDETAVLANSFNQMISDLKQSRDQLEEVNRDLDAKVKERTLQLEEQNHKVKEAQEALIRTTRLASAGEIAGRAAHEVLNPLTSLLTRVGIMDRKIKNEIQPQVQVLGEISGAWSKDYEEGGFEKLVETWKRPSQIHLGMSLWQEDLENIAGLRENLNTQFAGLQMDTQFLINEGARINKIINGMRKLSNIRSDRRRVSGHEIIKDCCHIMADLFQQRKYQIIQELHAENDLIHVDKDELVQAITNLMRNSLQSMHQAELQNGTKGTLRLVTALVNNHFQVYIEDTGVGILPENQNRLFDSQFTTKSPEEGTGLGLGISRRFVRGYGGDIEFVSSEPFQRTVFKISIPLAEAEKSGAAA